MEEVNKQLTALGISPEELSKQVASLDLSLDEIAKKCASLGLPAIFLVYAFTTFGAGGFMVTLATALAAPINILFPNDDDKFLQFLPDPLVTQID